MAMSAASKPFTVKGTRWMCTVWFVPFLLRQRGWAWVIIGIKARRAVRMAAPHRGSMPVVLPRGDSVVLCLSLDRCRSHGLSAADLPGLCDFVMVELELARPVVGARSPGLRRRSPRTRCDELGCFAVCSSGGYFHLPNLNCQGRCWLQVTYWHVRTKTQRHNVAQLQRV